MVSEKSRNAALTLIQEKVRCGSGILSQKAVVVSFTVPVALAVVLAWTAVAAAWTAAVSKWPAIEFPPAGNWRAGEIIAVEEKSAGSEDVMPRILKIRDETGLDYELPVARGVAVWREGIPASLAALAPVAEDGYQEAVIVLNSRGEVVAVRAFYRVLEVKVRRWDPNRGEIEVEDLNTEEVMRFSVLSGVAQRVSRQFTGADYALISLDLWGRVKKIISL